MEKIKKILMLKFLEKNQLEHQNAVSSLGEEIQWFHDPLFIIFIIIWFLLKNYIKPLFNQYKIWSNIKILKLINSKWGVSLIIFIYSLVIRWIIESEILLNIIRKYLE